MLLKVFVILEVPMLKISEKKLNKLYSQNSKTQIELSLLRAFCTFHLPCLRFLSTFHLSFEKRDWKCHISSPIRVEGETIGFRLSGTRICRDRKRERGREGEADTYALETAVIPFVQRSKVAVHGWMQDIHEERGRGVRELCASVE